MVRCELAEDHSRPDLVDLVLVGWGSSDPLFSFMEESLPLKIDGTCVRSDDVLYENSRQAIRRGLSEIREPGDIKDGSIAIVGSAPSVLGQLDKLRELQSMGIPIMAIRDSHDWLISEGITPTYALSVDPLPTAAECFKSPHGDTIYLIASQSDAAMFEFLKDAKVLLWHCYMKDGQKEPKGRFLIGGSTTSGLRGLAVAYVMGWREFLLFGLDSCMTGDTLRLNGTRPKPEDQIIDVQIERGGRKFRCNLAMALQAQNFQDLYEQMTDAKFHGFGDGLIQEIIRTRQTYGLELSQIRAEGDNGRISFIHAGGESMASYRYRTKIPAMALGAKINDLTASTLIFSKPMPHELAEVGRAKKSGKRIIVDFCDDHFEWVHYQEFLRLADVVITATDELAARIAKIPRYGRAVDAVIADPWEFPLKDPHCSGMNLLWFGNAINWPSIERILPDLAGYPLRLVSAPRIGGWHHLIGDRDLQEWADHTRIIDWSAEIMHEEFAKADIVILPATDTYKGANRAVEALRSGCFVIAEPHPAIMKIPGIYIGNIKEGLEWLKQQPLSEISQRISWGQKYVTDAFMPKTLASAWKKAIRWPTISAAENLHGRDGSTSIREIVQT